MADRRRRPGQHRLPHPPRERIAADEKAAQDKETRHLEATHCPGCNRREDEFDYKPDAGDGTKLCTDCQQEAWDTQKRNKLLAAREANAAVYSCYTCKGSIGGEPGTVLELRQQADPLSLECTACGTKRLRSGRAPRAPQAPGPGRIPA